MANYKETTAEGTSYVRCREISIRNPLAQQPMATFYEDTVVSIGGKNFLQEAGGCILPVVMDAEITILDPSTNLPTGEVVTHDRLYQLLYSAYIQTALERDAEHAA